jgi:hypothetical protein
MHCLIGDQKMMKEYGVLIHTLIVGDLGTTLAIAVAVSAFAGLGSTLSAIGAFIIRRAKGKEADRYIIQGQAGALGPNARVYAQDFQLPSDDLNLPRLAQELAQLRAGMKREAQGTAEQDEAIGAVAAAEKAADQGNGSAVLQNLRAAAGEWSLGIAEKIGATGAAEAIKRML